MASKIDVSALTLNPRESEEFRKFVVEQVFNNPALNTIHNVVTGVQMKEQIVLATQLGKTGLKANGACTRQASGAKSTLSEKYWEPMGIEDTLEQCQAEVDGLFKAYYGKIQSYKEMYDIQGSDEETFLALLLENAILPTVYRAAWLAYKTVAAAGAGSAGLISSGDIKFYDYIDGIWHQVFDLVTSGDIQRYTIALNAQTTTAAQMAVTADLAKTYLDAMWAKADPRLKAHPDARFYVSGMIWDMYENYLTGKGVNAEVEYQMNGLSALKYKGKPVINMATIWDVPLQADFYDNSVNQAYYLPHRALLTIPQNIPVGTLNESDLNSLETWYNIDLRLYKAAYGFSLDAKVLENYLTVAAY